MRTRLHGMVAAGILGAALTWIDPDARAAGPDDCATGKPPSWTVVTKSSSHSERVLVCNYTVSRSIAGRTYPSGVAITIEYYCTSGEGSAAFRGKTGKRDAEILRRPNKVISQEGPQAKNPDNPQRDGAFSTFFPGQTFGLFEKEWALFSPTQVVGTLVVLTTEKGRVAEPQRFGVDEVEPVAATLASTYAPSAPGCTVPKTITLPGAAGGAPGGSGSSSTIPIVIGVVAGVGGTVVVILVVNGRRKRGRPVFRRPRRTATGPDVFDPTVDQQRKRWNEDQQVWDPDTRTFRPWHDGDLEDVPDDEPSVTRKLPRESVPEQCRAIYDELADSQAEATWLDRTISEATKRVTTLEREFLQNKARASIQISIEIAQGASAIVGGMTAAAKAALIQNAGRGAATALQAAGDADTLDSLLRQRRALASLEGNASLAEAQQMYSYWTNKVQTALDDLPAANLARQNFASAQALESARARALRMQSSVRDPVMGRISAIEGEMEWLRGRAASQLGPLQEQLSQLDQQMRRLEPTLGGRGPVDAGRAARLAELNARRSQLVNDMTAVSNADRLASLASELTAKRADLAAASQGWDEMSAAFDQARAAREQAFIAIEQVDNVTASDLARLQQIQAKAGEQLALARLAARSGVAAELAAVDAKVAAIRTALVKLNTPTAPALPVRVVRTVLGPVVVLWQKAFGAGDTPQEMIDILLRYQEAILIERANVTKATSMAEQLKSTALPALAHSLEACMRANAPTPLVVPPLGPEVSR